MASEKLKSQSFNLGFTSGMGAASLPIEMACSG